MPIKFVKDQVDLIYINSNKDNTIKAAKNLLRYAESRDKTNVIQKKGIITFQDDKRQVYISKKIGKISRSLNADLESIRLCFSENVINDSIAYKLLSIEGITKVTVSPPHFVDFSTDFVHFDEVTLRVIKAVEKAN